MKFKTVLPIYLSEFTVRFCSWTVYSQLAVQLLTRHHMSFEQAGLITGAVLSLAYLCVFLGGFAKDTVLNEKQCVMLGILLILLGSNILLGPWILFYLAVSVISLGVGLVVPNLPLILSNSLGLQNTVQREAEFMIFYGFTNGGAILGPLLAGWISMRWGWHGVALLNDGMLFVWGVFIFFSNWWSSLTHISIKHYVGLMASMVVIVVLGSGYLIFSFISKYFIIAILMGYTIFFVGVLLRQKQVRRPIIGCFFLMVLPMVYFIGEFQVLSSLTTFLSQFGHLSKAGFVFPTSVFVALESVFVLIATALLYRLSRFQTLSLCWKAVLGLLLGSAAFWVLILSSFQVGLHSVPMGWFILVMALLGAGEVFLTPGVISRISALAPTQYKGRLMAGIYLSLAFSGAASGLISITIEHIFATENSLSIYHLSFMFSALLLLVLAIILVLCKRYINLVIANGRNNLKVLRKH